MEMSSITISLPNLALGEHIEIEVTIGGRAMRHEYRVEAVPWEGNSDTSRIDRLLAFTAEQAEGWNLVQISLPQEGLIHVTLRRRPVPSLGVYAPPEDV